MNYIYPNAYIVPVGDANMTQIDGDVTNDTPYTYNIVPSASTSSGIGYAISAMGMGLDDDTDIRLKGITDYPLALTTYVDDGSTGSYTLGYLPTSSDATGAAGNILTNDGVLTAVTSVVTTTGVVTQTAFDTSGTIVVAAYPTQFASA